MRNWRRGTETRELLHQKMSVRFYLGLDSVPWAALSSDRHDSSGVSRVVQSRTEPSNG
jgi:hypothetical protein